MLFQWFLMHFNAFECFFGAKQKGSIVLRVIHGIPRSIATYKLCSQKVRVSTTSPTLNYFRTFGEQFSYDFRTFHRFLYSQSRSGVRCHNVNKNSPWIGQFETIGFSKHTSRKTSKNDKASNSKKIRKFKQR